MISILSFSAAAQIISPLEGLLATDVDSKTASKMWSSMKTQTKKHSQCFNRAIVWGHDFDAEFDVKSRKYLIYYTSKYRKELDPKWGFHIAPMVKVNGQDFVFDREFHKKPFLKEVWAKWFVDFGEKKLRKKRSKLMKKKSKLQSRLNSRRQKSALSIEEIQSTIGKIRAIDKEMKYLGITETGDISITCKEIADITEFEAIQKRPLSEQGWCYTQPISMYYWGPPQLRELAHQNIGVYDWNIKQIHTARKQAFKEYEELWPEYKLAEIAEEREREERRARRDAEREERKAERAARR